mgnify:CR=1 FL=1
MAAHIAFFCPISAFGYLPCSFYRKSAFRTGCTQSLKVWPLALCHYLNDIELRPPLLLSFQQSNILINRRPAQITNPSQFRNVQLSLLVCRAMPQKCGGQIPGGYLRPSNLLPLGLGIRHSRPHTASYHGKLQLPGTHIAQQLCGALPGVAFVASAVHQKEVRGGIQGLS